VGITAYAAGGHPPDGGVPVVVAARELPVGSVVAAGDVEVRRVPGEVAPSSVVTDPGRVVGRPVAAVLTEGEVMTEHDVRTGSALRGQPSGTVAVWLPVPDAAVAEALSAGDRVDVHSPVDGRRVVEDVLVLAVRSGAAAAGSGSLIGATSLAQDAGGAWLALSSSQSTDLAAARGADPASGALLLALHPPPG